LGCYLAAPDHCRTIASLDALETGFLVSTIHDALVVVLDRRAVPDPQ